jgi:Na+-transporting methylmalonyl-CoA/oxaloacetate decarboxylase gamma subunit
MRRVFAVLIVLVALGIGLGMYLHWFGVTVDKEKMKEDTAEAKDKVKELGKEIGKKVDHATEKSGTKDSESQTATGKVGKVEAADSRFQLTTADNKDVTVYTDSSSVLRLKGEEFKLEDLRRDDDVQVAYGVKDGKNLATSVTVNRK